MYNVKDADVCRCLSKTNTNTICKFTTSLFTLNFALIDRRNMCCVPADL